MALSKKCIAVAQQFGELIAGQRYQTTWLLLSPEAQDAHPPEQMAEAVAAMTDYAPGPIQEAYLEEEFTIESWPAKRANDLAVVYISLNGGNFSEAVTLTLAEDGNNVFIRDLVWGRP